MSALGASAECSETPAIPPHPQPRLLRFLPHHPRGGDVSASAASGELGVTGGTGEITRTNIPARLDRLPWSRWHWIVIVALGITWILDGLEVTLVGSISGVLTDKGTLHFSTAQSTAAGSFYLAGAVG